MLWFVGLAVVAAPLLGALIATGGRWLAGDPGVVGDWWLGDGVGVLIAAPLVIVWSTSPAPPRPAHAARVRRARAATAALAAMVFGDDTGRVTELYLLLPLGRGAALLGRRHAAVAATAAVSAIGVAATFAGRGPVATGNVLDGLATLDGFLATFALAGLVLSAVETGRRLAEARSRRLHDQLLRGAAGRGDRPAGGRGCTRLHQPAARRARVRRAGAGAGSGGATPPRSRTSDETPARHRPGR